MTKTLADLRATKPNGRPMRSMLLCLAPEILARVQELAHEHDSLGMERVPDGEEGPPQRLVPNRDPRAAEIRDQLADALEEMKQYEGEMRLRANLADGEWRRWCNEHPSRSEGEPGYERDERVTGQFCDADALIENLAAFVHDWNGDPLSDGDWADVFEPVVSSADLASMATAVVSMYESRLDFQQLRTSLSTSLKRLNGSSSPATSASPTSDSTAGSPDSSTAATTETATA